jgi:hypothetical protein
LPWGGSHHGAERFLQVILPQAAKALDFGRFGYERFTAEGDQLVVLIRVGVAGSNAMIKILEHWDLKDEKVLSLWVAYKVGCGEKGALCLPEVHQTANPCR